MKESYSYSKLDTYESCRFKYKLRYVDKHYCGSGSAATEFGTAMHEAEEAIAKAIKEGKQIDYTAIKNKFILDVCKVQKRYPEDFSVAGKCGKTYMEKAFFYLEHAIFYLENFMKAHPTYEIVSIEDKFNVPYNEDVLFNGAIDRAFHDTANDTYLIQDIKSWDDMSKHDLKKPLQFVVYTIAACNLFNTMPEKITCQYYVPLMELVNEPIEYATKTDILELMHLGTDKLTEILSGIHSSEFRPTASALCSWCEFSPTNPNQPEAGKNLCPYHSIWDRELREKGTAREPARRWKGLEKHNEVLMEYLKTYGKNNV